MTVKRALIELIGSFIAMAVLLLGALSIVAHS